VWLTRCRSSETAVGELRGAAGQSTDSKNVEARGTDPGKVEGRGSGRRTGADIPRLALRMHTW